MLNNKLKRDIAKHGLVIIGLVIIGSGLIFMGDRLYSDAHPKLRELKRQYNLDFIYSPEYKVWLGLILNKNDPKEYTEEENRAEGVGFSLVARQDLGQNMKQFGFYVPVIGYPAYLILLFIIWSIKTLKDRT